MSELLRFQLSNPRRLPSGYTNLAWISSTGTQWIDTKWKATLNTRVYIEFEYTSFSGNQSADAVFGTRINNGNTGQFWLYQTGLRYGTSHYNYTFSANQRYNLYAGKGLFKVNSKDNSSTPDGSPDGSPNIYIFNVNNEGYKCRAKIYKMRIWEGDSLVRDFIPCSSTSLCGLFDLVTQTFYGNSGSGSFLPGEELKAIPAEYQQVEYLLSTGELYINTGVIPTLASTKITIDGMSSNRNLAWAEILGSMTSDGASNADTFRLRWQSANNVLGLTAGTAGSDPYVNYKYNYTNDTWLHRVEISGGKLYVNGTLTTAAISLNTSATPAYPIFLFATNQAGTPFRYSTTKLSSVKIYLNGSTLTRDLIPCYRRSDMKPGMYDLVGGGFYTNSGSGSDFLLGPTASSGGLVEWNGRRGFANSLPTNLIGSNYGGSTQIGREVVVAHSTLYDGWMLPTSTWTYGKSYTLSFKCNKLSGTMTKIGGHLGGGFTTSNITIDGVAGSSQTWGTASTIADDHNDHKIKMKITVKSEGDLAFYIQPNRGDATYCKVRFWDFLLEPDDVCTNFLDGLPHSLHSSPLHPSGDSSSAIGRNEGSTHFTKNREGYLQLPTLPNLTNGSVSFWLKLDQVKGIVVLGEKDDDVYYLGASSGGTGAWYHRNCGTITTYVDGVVKTTPTADTNWHHIVFTGVNLSSWPSIYINNYPTGNWNIDGCYYDFRVFDHVLQPSEVQAIYLAK